MIALITSGFPRISETFALNEFLALDRAGAVGAIFATKPGDGRPQHPDAEALTGRVELLPAGAPEVQARWVVARLGTGRIRGVHAYFAHTPAAVAERAADALRVPYSFSVHARDARKLPRAELRRRARRAACVIACNDDVAGELAATGARVELVPHGVDLERFAPAPPPGGDPLRLLAVGRFVEKKGFEVLIEALGRLTVPFRLRIVGDGPLRARLEHAADMHGVADRIDFCGALTHQALPAAYAAADAVVVPSVQDAGGDRDGLPNVVLEAMACGRAVVASRVAAIPSAVSDGDSGLLVAPGDATALGAALERLAAEPRLRSRLGDAGRARAERDYRLAACTDRLLACLEAAYA
jgi:glycosyltransferase involved in cell wall biosynthesis